MEFQKQPAKTVAMLEYRPANSQGKFQYVTNLISDQNSVYSDHRDTTENWHHR